MNNTTYQNPKVPSLEHLQYTGDDATCLVEISSLQPIDEEDEKVIQAWFRQIENPSKEEKVPVEQLISDGIGLVMGLSADANRLINGANRSFAEKAIEIGKVCISLKKLIRGFQKPWGVWAEENIPFVAKRNREKYMLLASRPDCWPFSFLGVDRLEMLCSVTKEMEGQDRVGDLLRKYNIGFDDTTEINLSQFKTMIDIAISNERLLKNGLAVALNLVEDTVKSGIQFDTNLIRRLKDVDACGGQAETLLQRVVLSASRNEEGVTPERRLQDFNSLGNRLVKTLEFIMQDQEQIAKIDRETFRDLIGKLTEIQELGVLSEETAE